MNATQRQQGLTAFFMTKGYHPFGSAAMVGNFSQEVGRDLPTTFRAITDHGSQGLAQWRLERLTKLEQFCAEKKLNVTELLPQGQFVICELEADYPQLNAMLKAPGSRSLANLTANFSAVFERPSKQYENLDNRINQAKICLESVKVPVTDKSTTSKATETIIGTGVIAGSVAVGAAWGLGSQFYALLATVLMSLLVIATVEYLERRKKQRVSPTTPAIVHVATEIQSVNELREALAEMKQIQQRVSAATAVYLLDRRESDKLLEELKTLGETNGMEARGPK